LNKFAAEFVPEVPTVFSKWIDWVKNNLKDFKAAIDSWLQCLSIKYVPWQSISQKKKFNSFYNKTDQHHHYLFMMR